MGGNKVKKLVQMILMLVLLFMFALLPPTPVKANGELTLTITLDKTSVLVGQSIGAAFQALGGTAPYRLNYSWYVIEGGVE